MKRIVVSKKWYSTDIQERKKYEWLDEWNIWTDMGRQELVVMVRYLIICHTHLHSTLPPLTYTYNLLSLHIKPLFTYQAINSTQHHSLSPVCPKWRGTGSCAVSGLKHYSVLHRSEDLKLWNYANHSEVEYGILFHYCSWLKKSQHVLFVSTKGRAVEIHMRINTVATNLSGKAGKVHGTWLNLPNAATETMDATYNGDNNNK